MSIPIEISTAITAAFTKSLQSTFEQMVFIPISIKDPVDKHNGTPTGRISGSIGLAGNTSDPDQELKAQFCLIFSNGTAKRIFRSMMMMEDDDAVEMDELRDVVGELTNITAGGAKTELSEHGYKLSLSLPSIVVGEDHYLSATTGVPFAKVIPVSMESETFYCEVSIS
jgi:CheY-specific phosphatase CheX